MGAMGGGRRLNLFFPEWQACGENNAVYAGARLLRDQLDPALRFESVAVLRDEQLETRNDILGLDAIVRQLQEARRIVYGARPATIFTLGGSCGVEVVPVSFLNQIYQGDLAVVWLDAHGDLHTPLSSPSKHFHGMPLRTLLGEGDPEILGLLFSRLAPKQVVLAGVRDLDSAEQEFMSKHSMSCITARDLTTPDKLVRSIEDAGFTNLYVHLDVDVLDEGDFPHALMPVANGISLQNLLALLRELAGRFALCGFSLVEFAPKSPDAVAQVRPIYEILDESLGRRLLAPWWLLE